MIMATATKNKPKNKKSYKVSDLRKMKSHKANMLLVTEVCMSDNPNVKLITKLLKYAPVDVTRRYTITTDIDTGRASYYLNLNHGTVLHYASAHNKLDIVKAIIEHTDIDINEGDGSGDSPLIMASRRACGDVVSYLLSLPNIRVNKSNKGGSTALHCAARNGHVKIVKTLVKTKNVRLDLRTKKHLNFLDLLFGHPVNMKKITLSKQAVNKMLKESFGVR